MAEVLTPKCEVIQLIQRQGYKKRVQILFKTQIKKTNTKNTT